MNVDDMDFAFAVLEGAHVSSGDETLLTSMPAILTSNWFVKRMVESPVRMRLESMLPIPPPRQHPAEADSQSPAK
jgi:hypothetical protein